MDRTFIHIRRLLPAIALGVAVLVLMAWRASAPPASPTVRAAPMDVVDAIVRAPVGNATAHTEPSAAR